MITIDENRLLELLVDTGGLERISENVAQTAVQVWLSNRGLCSIDRELTPGHGGKIEGAIYDAHKDRYVLKRA